jgi:hypothetical protein
LHTRDIPQAEWLPAARPFQLRRGIRFLREPSLGIGLSSVLRATDTREGVVNSSSTALPVSRAREQHPPGSDLIIGNHWVAALPPHL